MLSFVEFAERCGQLLLLKELILISQLTAEPILSPSLHSSPLLLLFQKRSALLRLLYR